MLFGFLLSLLIRGHVNNTMYFMLLFSTVDKSLFEIRKGSCFIFVVITVNTVQSHTCSNIAIFTVRVTVVKIGVNK